jgi:hypothetical protein
MPVIGAFINIHTAGSISGIASIADACIQSWEILTLSIGIARRRRTFIYVSAIFTVSSIPRVTYAMISAMEI